VLQAGDPECSENPRDHGDRGAPDAIEAGLIEPVMKASASLRYVVNTQCALNHIGKSQLPRGRCQQWEFGMMPSFP